ncbi:MAG: hypothetical protein MUE38_05765, partial [Flavihumibacter sp.]|jgi:hypothetical protein|nr:hypothetical protein [Flavihumibacter sp.]
MQILDIILLAFSKANAITFNQREIKLHIKYRLTEIQLKSFNRTVLSNTDLFRCDIHKHIMYKIELTEKGYDRVFQYNEVLSEEIIFELIYKEFKRFSPSKQNPDTYSINIQKIVFQLEGMLNHKQIKDRCLESAIKSLESEGLVKFGCNSLKLTDYGCSLFLNPGSNN